MGLNVRYMVGDNMRSLWGHSGAISGFNGGLTGIAWLIIGDYASILYHAIPYIRCIFQLNINRIIPHGKQ